MTSLNSQAPTTAPGSPHQVIGIASLGLLEAHYAGFAASPHAGSAGSGLGGV